MNDTQWVGLISAAIREALDARGVELPWSDTDAAAENVVAAIREAKEQS